AITCDLAVNLGDKNPICPATKRGPHPFSINFSWCAWWHFWICVIAPEVVSECFFAYSHKCCQIRRGRATNRQVFVSLRKTNFFDWSARKVEDEVLQRVHKQKAALLQSVNYGQLVRLHLANHALRAAFPETSRDLGN